METSVSIGAFAFNPATGQLSRDGVAAPLRGRALAVLTALVEAEGVVTKERLLTSAWPGVTVEEGNLTVQIAGLRKLLGEETIITVPRIGYRLRRDRLLPDVVELPRIAVLPIELIGSGTEDRYLADGIAEDIVTALGRFKEFTVLTRQSALAHQDALATNGVRYALHGSLRRVGERLRIAAHLSETTGGSQLWARTFDSTFADLFDLQDRITEAVVSAVAPEVQSAELRAARTRPASTDAYDLYLRGMAELEKTTDAGSRMAFELMGRAIEKEADNPVYLAAQSWVLQFRPMSGWADITEDDQRTCRELALRALGIGTDDARALSYCSNALLHSSTEFELAHATSRRALAANPNLMVAVVIAAINELHLGDLALADELAVRALKLSPAEPMRFISLILRAHVAIVSGRYQEALNVADEALALNLTYAPTHWMLTAANALMGRIDAAHESCARLKLAIPGTTVAAIRRGQPKKLPERIDPVLRGLRLAGLPES
ncbi:winged helix-turn-helix domain-containing protein [Rhodobacter sp. SY28-1]|uniref:winged helix-turn-helix domain-containing tetratricopeptide repeat protein n=1 Tax=Rhodobacter sp. SY28-1 TaxID=2562317 RepID=UPI0010C0281F|nr:winged helix-turn-helix domain-containing protein [Rhodobacter sp. SY28-1]